jgi:hypothetical protein
MKPSKKMNTLLRIKIYALCILLGAGLALSAQDSVKSEPMVAIKYYSAANGVPYLMIQSQLKHGKKYTPLPKQVVKVFLDGETPSDAVTKVYTDDEGKAKVVLQPELRDKWTGSDKHTFTAVLEANSVEDERTTALDITRAKVSIDTLNEEGVRSIKVSVFYYENKQLKPAKDVEMKVGIERLGSILSAGEEATYTTDSTGTVTVEFKRDSMPGDTLGRLVLAAKVEDNDTYGNLLAEETVAWGKPTKIDNSFFKQRTLWSTRFHTPFWLLFMAYSMVIGVWGTIVYLIFQIVKIKKVGEAAL